MNLGLLFSAHEKKKASIHFVALLFIICIIYYYLCVNILIFFLTVSGWLRICTKSRRKIFVHFRNRLYLPRPLTGKLTI